MDLFRKIVELNRDRTADSPVEKSILQALAALPEKRGTAAELLRRLPQMTEAELRLALVNLIARGCIQQRGQGIFESIAKTSPIPGKP